MHSKLSVAFVNFGIIVISLLLTIPDDYDSAMEYMNKQRRNTPPTYNAKRQIEKPIPEFVEPIDLVRIEVDSRAAIDMAMLPNTPADREGKLHM